MLNSKLDFLLAIDQGGHATRATIYNIEGEILANASCDVHTTGKITAGIEYIEHDANELVESVRTVVTEVQQQLHINKSINIVAGFATQRSTIVCWNKQTSEPLSPAISWQDVRAQQWITRFKSFNSTIQSLTGLYLSPHYGASKIKWCLENLPAVSQAKQKQELCIGPLSSYLLCRCVKSNHNYLVVDPANATRTLLMNRNKLCWDNYLLRLFSIPGSILPRIVPSYYHYGELLAWKGRCSVNLCTGDQSAAAFSQGSTNSNIFQVNIGSGAFVLNINQHIKPPDKILSGTIYTKEGIRINAWEGTVNGAAIALDWFQRNYEIDDIYNKLAQWLNDFYGNKSNKEFPIFINGIAGVGSPYWMASLDSRFIGEGSVAQRAVAITESIVFLLWKNIQTMNGETNKSCISITGGLSRLDGLCRSVADLSNMIVTRSSDQEATSRGLAWLLANTEDNWLNPECEVFNPQHNPGLQNRYIKWHDIMQQEQNKTNE